VLKLIETVSQRRTDGSASASGSISFSQSSSDSSVAATATATSSAAQKSKKVSFKQIQYDLKQLHHQRQASMRSVQDKKIELTMQQKQVQAIRASNEKHLCELVCH
jgi:ribosomal protein S11